MKLLWVRPGSDLALEILLFTGPAESPLGRFFLSSSTVARDGWRVPLGQEQKEAPPRHFSVKKTFGGPDIIPKSESSEYLCLRRHRIL